MAQTNYSKNTVIHNRKDNFVSRIEYLKTAKEYAKRGVELPQSKLIDSDVIEIRSLLSQREKLKIYIKENLSNESIAKKFSVHCRTIEKISSYETWVHLI